MKRYFKYRTQAHRDANVNEDTEEVLTRIGSQLEYDFNMAVFDGQIDMFISEEFPSSPLKRFLSSTLSHYSLKEDMEQEIALFSRLREKMLTIVTTNFDTFLEDHVFNAHRKVIGAPVFLGSEIGTLIKIHGCVTDPSSIILTREDYEKLERRSKVLVGKLIHLFTENPVIFLGYSLTDESIQRLLADIYGCVESSMDFKTLKERLIFVEYDESHSGDPEIGEFVKDVDGRSIHLTRIRMANYMDLLDHMTRMERITKLKEVFWLKNLVQDLVLNYQGNKTKIIQIGDGADDYSGDEVVVAIGKEDDIILQDKGLAGLEGDDVYHDIVFNDLPAVSSIDILMKVLSKLSRRNGNMLPVHKYLKGYDGEIDSSLRRITEKNPEDILNATIRRDQEQYDRYTLDHPDVCFEEIFGSDLSTVKKLNFLVLHAVCNCDVQELRRFLQTHTEDIQSMTTTGKTIWRKLVSVLDMRENKLQGAL